jgi:hypothetical protein
LTDYPRRYLLADVMDEGKIKRHKSVSAIGHSLVAGLGLLVVATEAGDGFRPVLRAVPHRGGVPPMEAYTKSGRRQ